MGKELFAVVWFLVVGIVFFGTYLGLSLPVAALQAVYAGSLLIVLVLMVLQRGSKVTKQADKEEKDSRV